jgi:2-polyprenyl-3-methyl-5-hydroxy-6-metoxy-1,4-benzoquinol methylase
VDVTGADINEHFLDQDRQSFPSAKFILISEDPAKLSSILAEKINDRQFDQIILLSIVQYFKSTGDLQVVVRSLKGYLKPNGKLIIADVLNEKTSAAHDAIGIMTQCIRKRKVIAFARFILYLILSDYRKTSKKNKLLVVSGDFMKRMADDCLLSLEELQDMTPHPTRTNYILSHRTNDHP